MREPNLGFRLTVKTKPNQAEFILEVTNQSNQDLSFEFTTSQEFDFAVIREGQEVWRWSADMMFAQAFHALVNKAGKTQTYKVSWDYKTLLGERVAPGNYVILTYFLGVSRSEPVAESGFVAP